MPPTLMPTPTLASPHQRPHRRRPHKRSHQRTPDRSTSPIVVNAAPVADALDDAAMLAANGHAGGGASVQYQYMPAPTVTAKATAVPGEEEVPLAAVVGSRAADAPPSAAGGSSNRLVDELERLAALRERGMLSSSEFQQAKNEAAARFRADASGRRLGHH